MTSKWPSPQTPYLDIDTADTNFLVKDMVLFAGVKDMLCLPMSRSRSFCRGQGRTSCLAHSVPVSQTL